MLSGTGNRNAVKHLKEVKVEHPKKRRCRAFLRWEFAPCVEHPLGVSEDFINGFFRIQLLFEYFRVTLVGQCKLIAQIEEPIVDRRCRKHQHLRLYARAYDLAHQNLVAIFAVTLMRTDAAFAMAQSQGDDEIKTKDEMKKSQKATADICRKILTKEVNCVNDKTNPKIPIMLEALPNIGEGSRDAGILVQSLENEDKYGRLTKHHYIHAIFIKDLVV